MYFFEEYWMGKGVNYKELWSTQYEGLGYEKKFETRAVHLFRIEFSAPPSSQPLFNVEAVYKTIKGCFHDLKRENLSQAEYDSAVPIFLYQISRGSSRWDWLGELRQLLTLGTTLADAQTVGQHLDNVEHKLRLLQNFPTLDEASVKALINAKTPAQIDEAISNLVNLGIRKIQVSEKPFNAEQIDIEPKMILLSPPELEGSKTR